MYNPFTGELFDAAIARLLESLDRTPRPMRLIYRNPVEHARLMGTGRATAIRQTKSGPRWRRAGAALVVYTLR
jgi:hypothetical protein